MNTASYIASVYKINVVYNYEYCLTGTEYSL